MTGASASSSSVAVAPPLAGEEVMEASRRYMARRLALLRGELDKSPQQQQEAASSANGRGKPASVVRSTATIGLHRLTASSETTAGDASDGGGLLLLASVTAVEGDAAASSSPNAPLAVIPSHLEPSISSSASSLASATLLLHAAALEFVTALAAAPLVAPQPSSSLLFRGACAGGFLKSRFHSHVWPGLQTLLLANATLAVMTPAAAEAASGEAKPADDDSDSSQPPSAAGLRPHYRLILSALRCVTQLARPLITFRREPMEDANAAGASENDENAAQKGMNGASSSSSRSGGGDVPHVPSFLPADAKARGKPALPSGYSVGKPLLLRYAHEVTTLLRAAAAKAPVTRGDDSYPAALRWETRAALRAVGRHR